MTVSQLKPIQVIVTNLSVTNIFILLLLVFPNNMTPFVPRKPLTDLSCKLGFFFPLVARSANMCSTCALSAYRFVTIAPSNWGQVMLRDMPSQGPELFLSQLLFGVLNNACIPTKVSGPQKEQDVGSKSKLVCSTSGFRTGMSFLQFAHDAMFVIVIVWTSVSMVIHLNRHGQRLQHICIPSQGHRGQAEIRATHTIPTVMVTFVCFDLLHCICNFFHISFADSRLWLKWITEGLAAGFPCYLSLTVDP